MKNKIKILILTIISIFTLPLVTKADMAAPDPLNYDVVITNKEGAVLYDWDFKKIGIIPFNEEVVVSYDRAEKNVVYLDVTYKGKYGFIKLSDAMVLENIDYSQLDKNENSRKLYTLDDTKLYSMPSENVGKVEKTIPAGQVIEYKYSYAGIWAEVEYDGSKGWIYIYPTSVYTDEDEGQTLAVLPEEGKNKIYLFEDVELYETYDLDKKIKTISKNQELEFKYSKLTTEYNMLYYIENKEIKGWVLRTVGAEKEKIAEYDYEASVIINNENGLKLYKNPDSEEPIKNEELPYLSKITTLYAYNTIYSDSYNDREYVSMIMYNGKKYWTKYIQTDVINYFPSLQKTLKEIILYKDINKKEKLDTTIPKGAEVKSLGYVYLDDGSAEVMHLVEYNDVKGFILEENLEMIEFIDIEEKPPVFEDEEIKDKQDEKDSLTPKQIAIICACSAVVLALVAIVTIKLVNKKKTESDN